jgi:hypothetical protein
MSCFGDVVDPDFFEISFFYLLDISVCWFVVLVWISTLEDSNVYY